MSLPYAQVMVDGFARLGALTYETGAESPRVGDAVRVPFGKREAVGVVVELLQRPPKKVATKPLIEVYGPRASESDMLALQDLSEHHVSNLMWSVSRLAPTKGKSAQAQSYGSVSFDIPENLFLMYDKTPEARNVILRPGFLPPELVAAHEAQRIHELRPDGQILIMCPTLFEVGKVLDYFPSGAGHLDEGKDPHAWRSFSTSTLKVAVTTSVGSWYAAPDLAGIIVVEENNPAHRTKTSPSIHNRDAAIARANATKGVCLSLITANPSPQSLGMPDVTVVQPFLRSGESPGTIRFLSDNGQTSSLPDELFLQMQGREEEFSVMYSGSATVCAKCYTRIVEGVDCCPLCGFTLFTEAGMSPKTIRKVYGDAQALPAAKAKQKRGLQNVIIPQATRLLTAPSLQPGAPAVDALMQAATAAGPGGTVYALVPGLVPQALQQATTAEGQLELARDYYRTAKKLHMPPFGRMFEITVRDQDEWDTSKFPGFVNGPKMLKGGQSIIVRCQKDQTALVRKQIDRLRKSKRKVTVAEPL